MACAIGVAPPGSRIATVSSLAAFVGTLACMWVLEDPMLAYMTVVVAIMVLFPTYRAIVAFLGVYAVFRISVRHDPVSGNYMSFVAAVAEAINMTVGGLAMVVTFMALIPSVVAMFSFDLGAIRRAFVPAVPLLTVVLIKYFIEAHADEDIMQLVVGGWEHVWEFSKNLKAIALALVV